MLGLIDPIQKMTSELDPKAAAEVGELTVLLKARAPLSSDERQALYQPYLQRAIERMLETGGTYGEATGAPGTAFNTSAGGENVQDLGAIDNDLAEQVRIVREGVDHYFANGELPAPYYAWRIAIILRKAKAYQLEADFLAGFAKHFRDGVGARYKAITDRAVKARRLAQQNQPSTGGE